MQHFRVNSGEAQKLFRQLFQREDDAWDVLVEGEEYDVSDGYDMTRPDNRLSLYLKVRKLKQGGHDYKAVLGPSTTLNEVSFQNEQRDTCDCVIETMWSKGHEPNSHPEYGRQTFPHASHRHCDVHAHMENDHVAHHHELHAENWHKNHTLHEIADSLVEKYVRDNRVMLAAELARLRFETGDNTLTLGTLAIVRLKTQIKFKHVHHRGERTLFMSHPMLVDGSDRGAADLRIANHPKASKRPVVLTHEE